MTSDPLTAYLNAKKQRALVLDGGFGTELARMGKDLGQDDLWSARILADDPAAIVRSALCAKHLGVHRLVACCHVFVTLLCTVRICG